MKVRRRLPVVVAAALLVLIALLATLQYQWLGQVSAAERERMKTSLAARAAAFAQDFDREITRAYLTFQIDPMEEGSSLAAHLAERHERWHASSRYPRLLKEIYVVPRDEQAPARLQRFNAVTRFIEPVDWPQSLEPIRTVVEPEPPQPGQAFVVRTLPGALWDTVPAVVVPTPVVMFAATAGMPVHRVPEGIRVQTRTASLVILLLDREYLTHEMLPSLAQHHLRGGSEGTAYEMAVVSVASRTPVYSTSRSFAPEPTASADAAADLFQVRSQEFGAMASEVRRWTSFVSTRVEPQRRPPAESQTGHRRPVPKTGVAIRLQDIGPADRVALEKGFASMSGARASTAASARWRLIVKHPAGSLETAVGQLRRRNLLVSSGILGVLGVSVGFLVISTRRAQDLARQQMEFVAAVSHELRTPLAVIRSAADNLAEGVVHEDPQVRKYGALVRGEGRRLSEMVEQILELAGIQSGQRGFALAPVPVLPLLRDVVSASATLIDEAGMTVEYEVPDTLPPVLGDEQSLRRVFQNLVGNAIKYGASGGWIGLRARSQGREVLVTVEDRGTGIEASELARIFEPFYRAPEAIAAQIQGAGLGLSLVQRIVEAHGGRITVRSEPGRGSAFVVHLPSASEEPAVRTTRAVEA